MEKYNLEQLKEIAEHFNLPVTGTKAILWDRVEQYIISEGPDLFTKEETYKEMLEAFYSYAAKKKYPKLRKDNNPNILIRYGTYEQYKDVNVALSRIDQAQGIYSIRLTIYKEPSLLYNDYDWFGNITMINGKQVSQPEWVNGVDQEMIELSSTLGQL
jgi:hypothetical protein